MLLLSPYGYVSRWGVRFWFQNSYFKGKNGYLSLRHSHMFTFFNVWKLAGLLSFWIYFYIYIFTFWDLYIFLFTKSCYLICCNFLYFVLFIFFNIFRYIANITYLPAVASCLILFPNFKNVLLFCFPFLFVFST
jgi:hypothetical protein